MPKIKCASLECKWNNNSNMCTFKGTVLMNDCDVMTVHEGRQHFHKCKMFEKSEYIQNLEEQFMKYMRNKE